jgi:hypothetical protein
VESKWKNCHIITFPGESLSKNGDIIYVRCFLWLKGEIEMTRRRERRRKKLLVDLNVTEEDVLI